ncbi:MAG: TonB family protein [Deltaproteobacteria bacterium]|jgi:TonB family protein|nr:TonB family protein [Deltaproteobacteria bacterium]
MRTRFLDEPGQAYWRSGGQRLALFLIIAAWLHLFAFLGFERLGFDYLGSFDDPITEPRQVELTLELNPAALNPSPTPDATPGPTPSASTLTPNNPTVGEEAVDLEGRSPEDLDPASKAGPPALTKEMTAESPEDLTTESLEAKEGAKALESGASLWPEDSQIEPSTQTARPDNTVSVEETAPRLKSYNVSVRGAVARSWILPPEARNNFQPGRFTAVMTLDREGRILVIAVEESSGNPSLDNAAMEAIRGAAPFEPFPAELADHDQLSFRLHFDYRAVYRPAAPLR